MQYFKKKIVTNERLGGALQKQTDVIIFKIASDKRAYTT